VAAAPKAGLDEVIPGIGKPKFNKDNNIYQYDESPLLMNNRRASAKDK
jgi:hypothetical protein